MMQFLKKIFGNTTQINFSDLLKEGAIILDVRTAAEFKQGHISGAINVPLNELENYILKLKKDQTIITCCASGMRSAAAVKFLKANNFSQVHNGGGWNNLAKKLA